MQELEDRRKKHPRRTIAAGIVTGLLALAATGGAYAFTPNVVAEVDHFIECFGWMLTDPETHAAECMPSNAPFVLETLSPSGPSPAPPPPPPPPPPPDDLLR